MSSDNSDHDIESDDTDAVIIDNWLPQTLASIPGRTRISQRSRRPATTRGPVLTLAERREQESHPAANTATSSTSAVFSPSSILFEDIESTDEETAPVNSGWYIVDTPPVDNRQFQTLLTQAASIGYRYKPVAYPLPRAVPAVPPPPIEDTVDNQSLVMATKTIAENLRTPTAPDNSASTSTQGGRSTAATPLDKLAPRLKQYLQDTIPTIYIDYCSSLVFPNQGTHSTFAQIIFVRLVDEACGHMNPQLRYGFKNNGAIKYEQLEGPAVSINDIVMFMGNIAPKTFSNYKTFHLKALTALKKLRQQTRDEPNSLSTDAKILFDHINELLTTPLNKLAAFDPQKYMTTEKFKKRLLLIFPKPV